MKYLGGGEGICVIILLCTSNFILIGDDVHRHTHLQYVKGAKMVKTERKMSTRRSFARHTALGRLYLKYGYVRNFGVDYHPKRPPSHTPFGRTDYRTP